MLDDPFTFYMPGQVKVFGIPWHGLVEQQFPQNISPNVWTLTLPSARQIPINGPNVRRYGGRYGTSLRYRDPRAYVPELTPEEQAEALAAGAEWRADVLLPYRYGPTANAQVPLMYFDGQQGWWIDVFNWLSDSQTMNFRHPLTLGAASTPRDPVIHAVAVNALSDASETRNMFFGNLGTEVVACTERGEKLLMAVNYYPPFRDYEVRLMELWEYRISGQGEGLAVEREMLWSNDDLFDEYEFSDTHPDGEPHETPSATPYWTAAGTTDDGINVVTQFEYDVVPLEGGNSSPNTLAPHTREMSRRIPGRVLGAYYGADDAVKYITLDMQAQSTSAVATNHALGASTEGQAFVENGQGAPSTEYAWDTIDAGISVHPSYSIISTMEQTLDTTLRVQLKDDGVVVSEFVASGSGTRTGSTTRYYIRAGDFNGMRDFDIISPPGYSLGPATDLVYTATTNRTSTHTFDGQQIDERTNSDEGHFQGLQASGFVSMLPGIETLPDLIDSFIVDIGYIGDLSQEGTRLQPCRYNAQMLALMREVHTTDLAESEYRVGAIACNGLTIPGSYSHSGLREPQGGTWLGLFGAYNAVTGEYVRDTPANCFYV